jgi:hypothetical protein
MEGLQQGRCLHATEEKGEVERREKSSIGL